MQINSQFEFDSPIRKLSISGIDVNVSYNLKSSSLLTTDQDDLNTFKELINANADSRILFWIAGSSKSVILKRNFQNAIKCYFLNHVSQLDIIQHTF